MATKGEILHITLRIGVRRFQMDVRRTDEYFYREAERLVNQRYQFYSGKYPGLETETYLMMTLLDVAVSLKRKESEAGAMPMAGVIEGLLADIDKALPEEA